MVYPLINRQYQAVSPPRAIGQSGIAGPPGQEVVVPVSATAGVIALQLLTFGQSYDASNALTESGTNSPPGAPGPGVVGHYVTIFADGSDIGVIVGPTFASVSGGAAPNLTTAGSIGVSGAYNQATGTCARIPAGQERRWRMMNTDKYLGFVGGGTPGVTGFIRVNQSSPNQP